jgi:hypothetical protein
MSSKKEEALKKAWINIVARAWRDETFKKQLLKNPSQVLKEHGIDVPGITFHVHASSKKDIHLGIPPVPSNLSKLDEEEIKQIIAAAPATFYPGAD